MKKLTNHQQKVLAEIKKSVAHYQSFKNEEEYISYEISRKNSWHNADEEYKEKEVERFKKGYKEISFYAENQYCYIPVAITPATLKALEDAGHIKKIKGDYIELVQLLK